MQFSREENESLFVFFLLTAENPFRQVSRACHHTEGRRIQVTVARVTVPRGQGRAGGERARTGDGEIEGEGKII